MSSATSWAVRAFCKCGHQLEKPFCGNIWFTQQEYPTCPKCAGSKYGYELKTVRWVDEGWFKPKYWEEKLDDDSVKKLEPRP